LNKTKIEWCDMTWNPVTGCLRDCEYCYARKITKRFPVLYPRGFGPTIHWSRLEEPEKIKKPKNIFVCSMADLFGEWVPLAAWIEEVFDVCKCAYWHRYLFLTKNPKRYVTLAKKDVLPRTGNFWYGASITGDTTVFPSSKTYNFFLSIEPLLNPIKLLDLENIKWVIIGAETGNRKGKVIPKREWIAAILENCRENDVPVFMKNSLCDVWKEPLIQEYPW